ncbi:amidohydrolase family protein [Cryobacterium sp. MLB-32]|uniref:amidohydrolase family protein n=1 Tax=Cryobacterium sp. MLB-32 TaxID=1529318 RepID=UPI00068E2D81|nr:amidohydrolase family protein [Cryobacterium sp. MLB-32]
MSRASTSFWCETLVIDGVATEGVRLEGETGRIRRVWPGVAAEPADVRLGTVLPGLANAHSHAFHRALRGHTHADGGDFWRWRERMYGVAAGLDPDSYYDLARAVFAEMLVSGFTAVGEFHYVHHQGDGSAYDTAHAMELALAAAARAVGIRLVLLDTAYLQGGIAQDLAPEQLRFGDGSAAGWLARWHGLRDRLDADDSRIGYDREPETSSAPGSAGRVVPLGPTSEDPLVTLGAALHSVRAVAPDSMREILAGLPADVPLHVHLSEQPQENADCEAAFGLTPTGLLHSLGALAPRLSAVHATHLTDDDRALLGAAGVTVVMCPTTEADLGDGIGPARDLLRAGAPIALGSDQNAVIDPFLEMRGLEMGERLGSGERGRFTPAELLTAGSTNGYAALGLGRSALHPGDPCDLVEIATDSIRTVGSRRDQLPLTATAGDVRRVIVAGRVVADSGRLVQSGDAELRPEALMAHALDRLSRLNRLDDRSTHNSPGGTP